MVGGCGVGWVCGGVGGWGVGGGEDFVNFPSYLNCKKMVTTA